jgi:Domain of unknown function (DUF5069)
MESLDLTKQPPRPPRALLPGLDLLMIARTVDKLRATLPGGNLGAYQIGGFSERVLVALALEEDALRSAVSEAKDDAEIAAWIAAHTDATRYAAINAQVAAPTVGERLDNAELMAKYPVFKTLSPQTPVIDALVADDAAAFA